MYVCGDTRPKTTFPMRPCGSNTETAKVNTRVGVVFAVGVFVVFALPLTC